MCDIDIERYLNLKVLSPIYTFIIIATQMEQPTDIHL